MLSIELDGEYYVLNIILPRTNFNDELLKKVVGLTHRDKKTVYSCIRSKNLDDIHRLSAKILTVLKLLDYGTK